MRKSLGFVLVLFAFNNQLIAQDSLIPKNSNQIIDPIVDNAIYFKRKNENLMLPKRIRGNKNRGFVIVEILLTKKSEIKNYLIVKAILNIDEERLLDYYTDSNNNRIGLQNRKILSEIKLPIENYIRNEIILKRQDSMNYDRKFKFLIRFK